MIYIGCITGFRNHHNFFSKEDFLFQKFRTDSVNHADSRDTKLLVLFPGNSILRFLLNFRNCVGGTHMRGCCNRKIIKCIKLFMLVIFVYKTKGIYPISCQPTQLLPT